MELRNEYNGGIIMVTKIKVAGTTFHPIPKGARIAITKEEAVDNVPCAFTDAILLPEPTNAYDPEAVAVYIKMGDGSAFHLGYLPKTEPLKTQIKQTTLATILIKDYGQLGNYNASFVIIEVKGM